MDKLDFCIISPGLIEAGSDRGCGCEVTDYHVALKLSNKMNTAIISPFYSNYSSFEKINQHFSILYLPFPAQKNYPLKSSSEMFIALLLSYFYSLFVALKIMYLWKSGLQIIVVHNPHTGLIPAFISKVLGIKIILAEGNITPWSDPYIYLTSLSPLQKIMQNYSLKMMIVMGKIASSIRAQSSTIKKGMTINGIDENKITVIPGGLDPLEFFPSPHSSTIPFNVGFVGRLTDVKGVSLLIKVIELAEGKLPNVKFYIYGDGPYKNKLASYKNIEHIGAVPRSQLNSELSKVHAVLFFQTELGRAEIESMSAGKAIIACDLGEMSRVMEDGKDCILCRPTPDDYVEAIYLLMEHPELLDKLSSNARKKAVDKYSWDSVAIQWDLLCQRLIKR